MDSDQDKLGYGALAAGGGALLCMTPIGATGLAIYCGAKLGIRVGCNGLHLSSAGNVLNLEGRLPTAFFLNVLYGIYHVNHYRSSLTTMSTQMLVNSLVRILTIQNLGQSKKHKTSLLHCLTNLMSERHGLPDLQGTSCHVYPIAAEVLGALQLHLLSLLQ